MDNQINQKSSLQKCARNIRRKACCTEKINSKSTFTCLIIVFEKLGKTRPKELLQLGTAKKYPSLREIPRFSND